MLDHGILTTLSIIFGCQSGSPLMLRRFLSTSGARATAAHRLVQQRVQGQLSLVADTAIAPKTRVIFVAKSGAGLEALQAAVPFPVSPAALREFQAKPQEKLYLYPSSDSGDVADQRVLLVGLGAEDKVTEGVLRDATHGALATVKAKRAKDVVLQVPALDKVEPKRVVELLSQVVMCSECVGGGLVADRVVLQASMLSNYQFDKYLSSKKNEDGEEQLKLPLEQIFLDAAAEFHKVRVSSLQGFVFVHQRHAHLRILGQWWP